MARYIYQNQTFDGMGRVIQGATATVYLAGTTTLATVYSLYAGGSAISGSAITADSTGYFKFFVDTGDYAGTQLFKITVSMPGYQTQTYDYVRLLS